MAGNPPKGRYIGGGRDTSAPTDVRISLLQVKSTPLPPPCEEILLDLPTPIDQAECAVIYLGIPQDSVLFLRHLLKRLVRWQLCTVTAHRLPDSAPVIPGYWS